MVLYGGIDRCDDDVHAYREKWRDPSHFFFSSDPINTDTVLTKEKEAQASVSMGLGQKSQVRADQGGRQGAHKKKQKRARRFVCASCQPFILFYYFHRVLFSPLAPVPGCHARFGQNKNSKTVNHPRAGAPWARAQHAFCGTGQIEKKRSSSNPWARQTGQGSRPLLFVAKLLSLLSTINQKLFWRNKQQKKKMRLNFYVSPLLGISVASPPFLA